MLEHRAGSPTLLGHPAHNRNTFREVKVMGWGSFKEDNEDNTQEGLDKQQSSEAEEAESDGDSDSDSDSDDE